jgi:hypothetical protein
VYWVTRTPTETHGAVEDGFVFVLVWATVKNGVHEFLDEVHEEETDTEDEFGKVEAMTELW